MRAALALVAGIVVVLTACASSSSGDSTEPELAGVEAIPGLGLRVADPSRHGLSQYEQALLDDRVLTLAEYEAAFLESIRCAENLGFQVSDVKAPTFKRNGTFAAYLPEGGDPQASARFAACKTDHTTGLSALWSAVYGPKDQERQEALAAMGRCLRAHGEDIPERPTADDVAAYLAAVESILPFGTCLREVETSFGFPPG